MSKLKIYSICIASAVLFSFMSSPMVFSQTKGKQTKSNVGKLARHDKKDFSFGLKIGVNSSIITDDDDLAKSKIGVVGGAFGKIKLGTDLGLSAELLYSMQGCEFKYGGILVGSLSSAELNLDYLNIPILINWYVPGVEGLTVKGGLQPAFLLSSKVNYNYVGGTSIGLDASDLFKFETLDIAIPLGVSYELDFGLLFDARYNIGITDVLKDAKGKNRVFQFTVGYRF